LFLQGSTFMITVINLTMIYTLAAMGLNLIMGYTGQVSIGHAAFMSIGAYTSAILVHKLSVPIPVGILAGTAFSAVFGLALGFPALRLSGFYLAIATMGFGVAIEQILSSWESVTGGYIGMRGITTMGTDTLIYYVILGLLILGIYTFRALTIHKTGRALKAIRENPIVAKVFGISETYYKVLAFVVGSAFAGLAGALYSHTIGYIAPSDFGLGKSLELLAIVVIGGMGSLFGPVFGATLYTVLPFIFSRIGFSMTIVFGSILIGVVLFMPRGLAHYIHAWWIKWAEMPIVALKRRKKSSLGSYVDTSFGKIHYVEKNEGQRVILCLHGNFGSWKWFEPAMKFIDNYRIIAVDMPNFGDSCRIETFSFEDYAKVIYEFTQKMNLTDIIVVAHSLGGAVAMELSASYPRLVDSMILVDPCPVRGLDIAEENVPFLELYKRNRTLLKESIKRLLFNVKNRRLIESLTDEALKMNPDAILEHANNLASFDLSHKVKSIRCRTLLLWGDMDSLITRKQMEETAQSIPNCDFKVLHNIGHTIFIEDSGSFSRILLDFLGGMQR